MKNMIRKVAAVGAGAGMLLSTLGGALAADLGDLPAPFVANGAYVNTAFVVGASAGTNDDAARTKLVSYFGSSVTASEDLTYNSDDDSEDDLKFNGTDILTGFGEIDSGMIDTLFEGEIEVNDTDYTAREIINFSSGAVITTSLTGGQEEFGADPYLTYDAASIDYGYAFTDAVPNSSVDTDETLQLSFLGKDIEIKTIRSTDSVTLDVTDTVSLNTGETSEYKGHTVKLVRVYTSSAAIDVDGEEQIISTSSEKDFGEDIQVEVDTVGESDDPSLSSAVLKLSEQGVSSTVSDGEAFELFVDYDTNSHSPWVWDIESAGGLQFFGITNRWNTDDLEPSQSYKSLPITVGGKVVFPNSYGAVMFDSVTTETYMDMSIEFDESRDLVDADDTTSVDNKAVAIFTADGDFFEVDGSDYHTLYIVNNATTSTSAPAYQYWGEDDDGEHYTTATTATFKYNDDDDDITFGTIASTVALGVNLTATVNITANDWNIKAPWNFSVDDIGVEGEDEASDLLVNDTGYGAREYDILLADGTIVVDPKANTGSDKIEIKIPNQDVEATFKVYTVASSSDVEAVLKADSAASGYDNLILVGGPCVNTLTASFMGLNYPACEAASTIAQDKAVVKMLSMDGKMALVVAGWEQADTLRAANKVAAGGLSGDSLIVE
jgi:hypothetical protein